MSLSYKLLRVEPIGIEGKTAFVMMEDDVAEEYRLVTITSIPARYSVSQIEDWLIENFTLASGWLLGRTLDGRELEVWLTLWQAETVLENLETDAGECTDDIAIVQTTDLAGLRDILERVLLHQRYLVNVMIRLVKVIVRLIKIHAPTEKEAAGGE